MFYQNRKHLKGAHITLDLKKLGYGILKDAIDLEKKLPDLDYVYADVNCCLKVIFKDGTSNFFNDIENLQSINH